MVVTMSLSKKTPLFQKPSHTVTEASRQSWVISVGPSPRKKLPVRDLGVAPLRHKVLTEGVLPEAQDSETWNGSPQRTSHRPADPPCTDGSLRSTGDRGFPHHHVASEWDGSRTPSDFRPASSCSKIVFPSGGPVNASTGVALITAQP